MLFMGLLSFIFLVVSIRTNIIFVVIFASLTAGFATLTGAFWQDAAGNTALGAKLLGVSGGVLLIGTIVGWYLLLVAMLASLDFPFTLPVGDLSYLIKSGTERSKEKEMV